MPSSTARQRTRQGLGSTPGPTSASAPLISRAGRGGRAEDGSSRLRRLLSLLILSTSLLVLLHMYRAVSNPNRTSAIKEVWNRLPTSSGELGASTESLLGRVGLGPLLPPASSEKRPSIAPGLSVVPGQDVVDHSVGSAPQVSGMASGSPMEGVEVDREALTDLDQDTLKAMFDALYGRGGPLARDED